MRFTITVACALVIGFQILAQDNAILSDIADDLINACVFTNAITYQPNSEFL